MNTDGLLISICVNLCLSVVAGTGFVLSRERLREILIQSEDVCACDPASLYCDASVVKIVLKHAGPVVSFKSSRDQLFNRPGWDKCSVGTEVFASVISCRPTAGNAIPPCCSQIDPRRLRRCLLWCRHRGRTSRIAIGAIHSSSDAQARPLPRRSCRHGCRTG